MSPQSIADFEVECFTETQASAVAGEDIDLAADLTYVGGNNCLGAKESHVHP